MAKVKDIAYILLPKLRFYAVSVYLDRQLIRS